LPQLGTSSRGFCVIAVSISLLIFGGCAGTNSDFSSACTGLSPKSLVHFDAESQQFLDQAVSAPSDNSQGNIIWNTRYYMEALLDAYEATGNSKYLHSFVSTGTVVMNELQQLTLVNAADPSAPGNTIDSPTITVTGWPTQLGSFSESVPIPAANGETALYAQNLDPTDPNGPVSFDVTSNPDGTLTLSWVGTSQTLQSNTIRTLSDLQALAAAPLVQGQTYGRINATGSGLPLAGTYNVNSPLWTIWHEQTGGILLPFARFLLLAKRNPSVADPSLVSQWTSQVVSVADSYEDEFVPDKTEGLRLRNPIWLTNSLAGTNAAADYAAVEATMRMFLYELTTDSQQLAIAQGLVMHQKTLHWQKNAQGWLLLKSWPCLVPWTTSANAPAGNIWSFYAFDTTTPEAIEDGAAYVDLFHEAQVLGLSSQLGITPDIYTANRRTLAQYLFSDPSVTSTRPSGLLRGSYPTANSKATDPLSSSQYTWSSAWYAAPEIADDNYVEANWKWMLQFNQNPQGQDVGYFLKAWAVSEAAEMRVCKIK
jgi:hypothetical protein